MAQDWSQAEAELIVKDYFQMLMLEIKNQAYNKAQHNRDLLPLLNNRSKQSIEFKHQNISAVLTMLGLPYINGYKPAWNYQKILEDIVIDYLRGNLQVETSFKTFSDSAPIINRILSFESLIENPPERKPSIQEPELLYRNPVKINYLEVEQANARIGASGEGIVVEYERWRLIKEGKESLADRIEWVSKTLGDGLGYDILSKNSNGTDRYIEVKSTKLTKEAPIFFTKNEYDFSKTNRTNYFLYRVFNLKQDPKLFIVNGTFDDFCSYKAIQFKGYL